MIGNLSKINIHITVYSPDIFGVEKDDPVGPFWMISVNADEGLIGILDEK